jgi:putative ABC transport system permease protein
LTLLSGVLGPWMEAEYGLLLSATWPTWQELRLLGWVLLVGTVASLLPGYRAYRMSLADGLTPRV